MDDLDEPESTAPADPDIDQCNVGRRRVTAARARNQRARVTNGTRLLPTVPGTSIWARILRDNLDAMITHLGGDDVVSEPQRMACRRIAVLETEMVFQEDKIGRLRAKGSEPDAALLDLYSRLSNTQRRHLEAVGWQRMPKDVTPDIHSYLAAKAKKEPGDEGR